MSEGESHLYEFGPYLLDTAERRLLCDGRPVPLTPKSYDLLVVLVARGGRLVEKDDLMKVVWGDSYVEDSNLTNNVYALRKALGEGGDGRPYIETVPKRGYRFTAPVRELSSEVLVVEKRSITRVVTGEEELIEGEDGPAREGTAIIGTGEAQTALLAPAAKEVLTKTAAGGVSLVARPRRRWPLIALLGLSLAAAGFFAYRFLTRDAGGQIEAIAVLPFRNESGNPEFEYLSDGMTESLINSLSQLPHLKVIARNSAFEYKGKDVGPQEAARQLGVQAVLMGRVGQRGDSLVVSVELMDARDRTQVWGAQYTRPAADLQAVQEEITHAISEKLRLRLSGAEVQQLAKRATGDSRAYQFYLNGLFHLRKDRPEDVKTASDYFNQAVTLDPNFALAWVGVAQANLYFAGNSLLDPKEPLARAKAAALKALALDEALAEAHVELAGIRREEWDWTGAERGYRRAIQLNPNLVDARTRYSYYLSVMERHAEALAEIRKAQELDPLRVSLKVREFQALMFARRYDEAAELFQSIRPEPASKHNHLSSIYEAKGMYEQAVDEYRRMPDSFLRMSYFQIALGHALAMSGRRGEAQAILDRLKTTKEYVSPAELAILHAGLGDKEGALASLERAYAAHDLQLQYLKVEPRYDSLRSDPRFQDLLRRVGLTS